MKKNFRKGYAFLLAVVMLLSCLAVIPAMADEDETRACVNAAPTGYSWDCVDTPGYDELICTKTEHVHDDMNCDVCQVQHGHIAGCPDDCEEEHECIIGCPDGCTDAHHTNDCNLTCTIEEHTHVTIADAEASESTLTACYVHHPAVHTCKTVRDTGSLTMAIRRGSSTACPGASITILDADGNSYTVLANSSGVYTFTNIPTGSVSVRATYVSGSSMYEGTATYTVSKNATTSQTMTLSSVSSNNHFNHIDIESEASFTYTVDGKTVTVDIDFETAGLTGIEIWQVVDGVKTKLGTAGNWQDSTTPGFDKEYRIDGVYPKSASYIVKFSFQVSINGVMETLTYEETYSYNSPNNVCPGTSSSNRGIDVALSGDDLSSFFTKGSLTIHKTIDGLSTSSSTSIFSFKVDGPYGNTEVAPVTNRTLVTIKGADFVTLNDLPVGTYYIEEVSVPSGYIHTGSRYTAVVKTDGVAATLYVNNDTVKNNEGYLTIKKTVSGLDSDRDFTFQITNTSGYSNTVTIKANEFKDGDGEYTVGPLTPGTYTVTETNADVTGYLRDTSNPITYNATVTSKGNVTVSFTNAYRANTTTYSGVKKWVGGTAPRPGITLKLFADSLDMTDTYGQPVWNTSGGDTWTFTYSGLPKYQSDGATLIKYTVTEDAVEGYNTTYVDATSNTVVLSGGFHRITPCSVITFSELGNPSYIVAAKGQTFVVWTSGALDNAQKVQIIAAIISAADSGPFQNITVSKTTFISGANTAYNTDEIVVDQAGDKISFKNSSKWSQFAYGGYTVIEDSTPFTIINAKQTEIPTTGTLTINKTVIGVAAGDYLGSYSFTVTGEGVNETVIVTMTGATGSASISIEPGTYTVTEITANGVAAIGGYTHSVPAAQEVIIEEVDGVYSVSFTNPYKAVTSVTAAKNYFGAVGGAVTVQLYKGDGVAVGTPEVLDGSNSYSKTWTLLDKYQSDGTTLINYYVRELDGTTVLEAGDIITVGSNDYRVSYSTGTEGQLIVTNTQIIDLPPTGTGSFIIEKVDDEGNLITSSIAVFTLTDSKGSSVEYSTDIDSTNEIPDGTLTIPGLVIGETYTLTEKTAPAGYDKSSVTWTIKVTASKVDGSATISVETNAQGFWERTWQWIVNVFTDTNQIVSGVLTVTNSKLTDTDTVHGGFTVNKTDGMTALAGATFGIFDNENCTGNPITTYSAGTVAVNTADTALASSLPAAGSSATLYMKETIAPTDYDGVDTVWEITISASENSAWNTEHTKFITTTTYAISVSGATDGTLTVANTRQTGSLTITKDVTGDLSKSDFATDAFTFTITNTDSYSRTVTLPTASGDWSVTIPNLPTGEYTVTETDTDVASYIRTTLVDGNLASTKTVQITNNDTATVAFENNYARDISGDDVHNPPSFDIIKTDAADSEEPVYLDGAVFALYADDKAEGEPVVTSDATVDGETTITIPASYLATIATAKEGTLYLKETIAPTGYILGDTIWEVKVTLDNVTVSQSGNFWQNIYNWLVGVFTGSSNDILADNENTLPVTNEKDVGSLTVSKTVRSDGSAATTSPFSFQLYKLDEAATEEADEDTYVLADETVYTVTTAQSTTIEVEPGTYKVVELTDASHAVGIGGYTFYQNNSTTEVEGLAVTTKNTTNAGLVNYYMMNGYWESDPPTTDFPETDPPMTDFPETDPPMTDFPETDPPMTDAPVIIGDPDSPLADGPQTGDNTMLTLLIAIMVISGAGVVFLLISGRKKGKHERS